jgi:hypothetical protein
MRTRDMRVCLRIASKPQNGMVIISDIVNRFTWMHLTRLTKDSGHGFPLFPYKYLVPRRTVRRVHVMPNATPVRRMMAGLSVTNASQETVGGPR